MVHIGFDHVRVIVEFFNSFTSGLLTTALRLPWPFSSVFNYYDLSKHHVISLLVQPDSLRTKMVFSWFTSKPETNGITRLNKMI